ncbi:MAG TPA: DNA polymerase/3'-5' exonuclease PolX [Burkholderiales bacterium]|nr:DNA polymerase/3'-5' exonuclease PolX [Burkholderiales bacterium]
MPVHNADIAGVFDEIADLLEIQEANPFRVRAYRNAARTVENLSLELAGAVGSGQRLPKLPGIGADLAAKIEEIVRTGTCGLLVRLRKELPAGVTELLRVPGLGPKRVKALYRDLAVKTLPQLLRAAEQGRVRELQGFGPARETQIAGAVKRQLSKARRFKLAVATQYARPFADYLRGVRGVDRVEVAGSYRRMRDTVGDLDILVTAKAAEAVMTRFAAYPEVAETLAKGETRASVLLRSGLQVDLRVVDPDCFGAALHYFTGSKAHNVAVRRMAQRKGLKISEYGVFRGSRRIAGETEESVYAAVGLPWIAPELREDRGELEAAARGELPKLVELGDLTGDLHVHTKASDGHDTVRDMALAAKAHGFAYLAITDHSQQQRVAHGLDATRLAKQIGEIDRLNGELGGITLLKGAEVDILDDGALDLPDSILGKLDVVVAAVHSRFDLPRARQTARILKALDHPLVNVLAHPTGRLIEEREPYDVDMARIVRRARERGVLLEVNAQPSRLDLTDVHCRMAKDEGALVSLDSDAHSVHDLDDLRFGIGQARRGWLEARDVANTRPLKELRALLERRRRR